MGVLQEKNEAVLANADAEANAAADSKKKEYESIWKQLGDLGVKENNYTRETPDSLAHTRASVHSALSERTKRFQAELALQVRTPVE